MSEIPSYLNQIEKYVASLVGTECSLDHGYVKLGLFLNTVSKEEYWRGNFKSFSAYLDSLAERYGRGRSTLYNYFSTIKTLLPYIHSDHLSVMGIEKARVLKQAVKFGTPLSEEVIKTALDPDSTVRELRELLFKNENQVQENGVWRDLDFSGYYTDEEHETVRQAVRTAKHTDPVIDVGLKDWQINKEVLLRFSMEFLGAHALQE